MLKKNFFAVLLTLSCHALNASIPVNDTAFHQLNSTYIFNGDAHGDFAGNPVCVLSDGSAWKVHPEDDATYSNWEVGDRLHVQVRTSFYWFKREHKFELKNDTRNESVRAMLVQYPAPPLHINAIHYTQIGSYLRENSYKDINGNTRTTRTWMPMYTKEVYLSDGTVWRLENDSKKFAANKYVYFSIQRTNSEFLCFLIAGTEREAVWSRVERVL